MPSCVYGGGMVQGMCRKTLALLIDNATFTTMASSANPLLSTAPPGFPGFRHFITIHFGVIEATTFQWMRRLVTKGHFRNLWEQ